jgi:acetylornithine deacetylase/succinyl-diaminopimelate desuccinylase-like protein
LVFAVKSGEFEIDKKGLIKEVRHYRQNNERKIINEFIEFLSIPNVSADTKNIRKNALFIKEMMEKRGIEVKILETKGNPVVYGELNVPNATQTLLFYVHYDGQPVEPSKWIDSLPFKPMIRKGKLEAGTTIPKPIQFSAIKGPINEEWRIYARGSSDDRAPIICYMAALDAINKSNIRLKNNLKFIFEGEEEAGSTNLRECLVTNQKLLKSDILFMCDGPGYFSGDPTLFFGVRGIVSLQVTVYGANTNLHSGHYGNWAPNPAMSLAKLLASMKDDRGRVLIDGFYDTVVPLGEGEKKALNNIPDFDDKLKSLYGFLTPEDPQKRLTHAIQQPSLNICGIRSGWVGNEARTIVPSLATASLDIRMVKGNEGSYMAKKVVDFIKKQGYFVTSTEPTLQERLSHAKVAKVALRESGYKAYRTSMDLPISRSVIKALYGYDSKTVMIPTLGGSLPISMFSEVLDIPVIGIPIANYDNNQHQANENIRIGHLWKGIETFATIFMMGKAQK